MTGGTYRLWDTDFLSHIDLSSSEKDIVYNILSDPQKNDLYGEYTYKTVLTDQQMQTLRDNPLFWQEV
jgi:hypothetical protein